MPDGSSTTIVRPAANPREHGVFPKPFGIVRQSACAVKPTNKAGRPAAEPAEPRAGTKGNADQQNARRAQDRESASSALDRIRRVARERKKEKFTSLSHHISVELLEEAFYELKQNAAPGV